MSSEAEMLSNCTEHWLQQSFTHTDESGPVSRRDVSKTSNKLALSKSAVNKSATSKSAVSTHSKSAADKKKLPPTVADIGNDLQLSDSD